MLMIVTRALLATLLLALAACQQSPEQARQQLADLDIQFNQNSFGSYIKRGDDVVVNLFLISGMDPNTEYYFGWIPCPECPLVDPSEYRAGIDGEPSYLDPLYIEPSTDGSAAPYRSRKQNFGTVLHLAVSNQDTSIVEALLDAGADVNAEDSEGKRPIDYVDEQTEVYELLR